MKHPPAQELFHQLNPNKQAPKHVLTAATVAMRLEERIDFLNSRYTTSYYNCQALQTAITSGHFQLVKHLFRPENLKIHQLRKDHFRRWAGRGDLELVKWFHSVALKLGSIGWLDKAASASHLHIVRWVHENFPGKRSSTAAMDRAARCGHFEIVQWLHEHRMKGCTSRAMNDAATNGHFAVVQWLHANRSEGCTTYAMDFAAAKDHLEVVQWLHTNRAEGYTTLAMDAAASSGHLEIVQRLHENRPEGCTATAMDLAARGGHIHVVQWLHENRREGCTTRAMDQAGSLEIAQWLHENQTEGCTSKAMTYSTSRGSFEILIFLRDTLGMRCSAGATTCALFGNGDAMQWAIANTHDELDAHEIKQKAAKLEPFFQWPSATTTCLMQR